MPKPNAIKVAVETGSSKTFATALDWPGWSRSGRDEASALQSLFDYGTRYARVLESTSLGFSVPQHSADLTVIERVTGNATTDFGAPNVALAGDHEPVTPAGLRAWQVILTACWASFDEAVQRASGRELSKGPRGGGRDLDKIVRHVQEVDASYLSSLGGKWKQAHTNDSSRVLWAMREVILAALEEAVRGDIPATGPRGGTRWTPRYFVRRLAWHELDHTWEIEDRACLNT